VVHRSVSKKNFASERIGDLVNRGYRILFEGREA